MIIVTCQYLKQKVYTYLKFLANFKQNYLINNKGDPTIMSIFYQTLINSTTIYQIYFVVCCLLFFAWTFYHF